MKGLHDSGLAYAALTALALATLVLGFTYATGSGQALPMQSLPNIPGFDKVSVPQGIIGLSAIAVPPESALQQYNDKNAGSLLTCPNSPNSDILNYFMSGDHIGGDACLADLPELYTLISASGLASYDTSLRGGGQEHFESILKSFATSILETAAKGNPSAVISFTLLATSPASVNKISFSVGIQPQTNANFLGQVYNLLSESQLKVITNPLYLGGAASVTLQNLGYSGQVSTPSGNVISSAYNTNSFIFQSPPASFQKGLWSWTAQYVDLSKVDGSYLDYSLKPQKTNYVELKIGIDLAKSIDVVAGGPVYTSLFTCTYPYYFSYNVINAKMQNIGIPIPAGLYVNGKQVTDVATQFNDTFALQYNAPTIKTWAAANILPVFYYNISMPASTSNLNSQMSYLNQSFMLYSPHNFLQPNAFLDPYTVDLGSGLLFADTKGNLAELPYNTVDLNNLDTKSIGSISPISMFIASMFGYGKSALTAYAQQFLGGDTSHISQQKQPFDPLDPQTIIGKCNYYAQQHEGCTQGPVQMGSLIGMYIKNPTYIYSAPNGDIYVINYSESCGLLCISSTESASLFVMRFYPFGQFNPPMPIPTPIGSGFTPLAFDNPAVTSTPSIAIPSGTSDHPALGGTWTVNQKYITAIDIGQSIASMQASWGGGIPPYTVSWTYGTDSKNCAADTALVETDNAGGAITSSILVPPDPSNPTYPADTPGTYYYCVSVSDAFGSTIVTSKPYELQVNSPFELTGSGYSLSLSPTPYSGPSLKPPDSTRIPPFLGGNVVTFAQSGASQTGVTVGLALGWQGGTPPYTITLEASPPQGPRSDTGTFTPAFVSSVGSAPCGSEINPAAPQTIINKLQTIGTSDPGGPVTTMLMTPQPDPSGTVTITTWVAGSSGAPSATSTKTISGSIYSSAYMCAYISDATGMTVNTINYANPDWRTYYKVEILSGASTGGTGSRGRGLPINIQSTAVNATPVVQEGQSQIPDAVQGSTQQFVTSTTMTTVSAPKMNPPNPGLPTCTPAQINAGLQGIICNAPTSISTSTIQQQFLSNTSPCEQTDSVCQQWINTWKGYWYNLTVDQSGQLYIIGGITLSQKHSTFFGLFSSFNKYNPGSTGTTQPTPQQPAATCPDQSFQGDTSTLLTLAQLEACASNAGFTGDQLTAIVSIAAQESYGGMPGATGKGIQANCKAEGILQEGSCAKSPGEAFLLPNYHPSTCSTYKGNGKGDASDDWSGIYYNPMCAFQWAYAYINSPSVQTLSCASSTNGGPLNCFWGSYQTGAYCKYAPVSYSGYQCTQGGGQLQWSGTNQQPTPNFGNGGGIFDFIPSSVAVDDSGDVFIVGLGLDGNTMMGIMTPNGMAQSWSLSFSNPYLDKNFKPSTLFAVSPGGQFAYLAGRSGGNEYNNGNILIFNTQTHQQVSAIDLSYSSNTYNLDISKYLKDGGPFGNQALSNAYSDFLPNNDIDSYHVPIAMTESHGTLYILDLWSFKYASQTYPNGFPSRILMLRAFDQNGTEVKVNPSLINDVIPTGTGAQAVYQPGAPTLYPPYGWPLSVNISGVKAENPDPTGIYDTLTYCLAGCTKILVPPTNQYAYNNYPPIGPWIPNHGDITQSISTILSGGDESSSTVLGFQANYENIGYLLAHVTSDINPYSELLTMKISMSNYTNPSFLAGTPFACYNTYDPKKKPDGYVTPCVSYSSATKAGEILDGMQPPLLGVPDAFKYVESQGSPEQYVTLPVAVGAASAMVNGALTKQQAQQTATTGCTPGSPGCSTFSISSITSSTGSASSGITSALVPEYLKSKISGYVMVPYMVSYDLLEKYSKSPKGEGCYGKSTSDCPTASPLEITLPVQPPSTAPIPEGELTDTQCNWGTEVVPKLACTDPNSPCKFKVYGYSLSKPEPAVANAVIEGGPTYLVYNNTNFNDFYKPNISDAGAILPPNIGFNVYSNRQFGEIYVNQSVAPNQDYMDYVNNLPFNLPGISSLLIGAPLPYSPGKLLDSQLVVNQSHLYDYGALFFYHLVFNPFGFVGPVYELESQIVDQYTGFADLPVTKPTNQPPADVLNSFPLFYFMKDTASLAMLTGQLLQCLGNNPSQYTAQCNAYMSFSGVQQSKPVQLQLFDEIKTMYNQYSLTLNWSKNNNVLGYNRLIYTFVDRFNNTITAPLDVDIANVTSITLNATASVSTSNPNQTIVTVNGIAGYYQGLLNNQFAPLPQNSPIYLYYDQNINYYNPTYFTPGISALSYSYINYAQQCAFGGQNGCILANPLNLTQDKSFMGVYTQASYPTYNSPVACAPQANSLLDASYLSSLYECNIYGNYNLPKTCGDVQSSVSQPQDCAAQAQQQFGHMSPQCVAYNDAQLCNKANAGGYSLFCVPNFANGTGTLTPQIGLLPSKTHTITRVEDSVINGGTVQTDKNGEFSYQFTVCGTGSGRVLANYYGAPFPQPGNVIQPPLTLSNVQGSSLKPSQLGSYAEYSYTFAPASAAGSFLLGSYQLSFGTLEAPIAVAIVTATAIVIFLRGRRKGASSGKA